MPSYGGTQAAHHMDEEGEESQLPALRGTASGGQGQAGLPFCLFWGLVLYHLVLISLPGGLFSARERLSLSRPWCLSRAGCDHVSVLRQVIEFDDGAGSVLRIQPLRVQRDEAIYECTATNSLGEINTSAKLSVLEGTCWKGMWHRRVGDLCAGSASQPASQPQPHRGLQYVW